MNVFAEIHQPYFKLNHISHKVTLRHFKIDDRISPAIQLYRLPVFRFVYLQPPGYFVLSSIDSIF